MNTFDVINSRRSIRKFKDKPVAREILERLLDITIKAPSAKNRQPWRFIVLTGDKKEKMTDILYNSAIYLKENDIVDIGSCEYTVNSMRQAPVIILIYNAENKPGENNGDNRYAWSANIQSIGGAIQTMLLEATDMGLGTLWICDVFYAEQQISEWLNREDELVAAVAIGYADENPNPRPRRNWQEVTEWLR